MNKKKTKSEGVKVVNSAGRQKQMEDYRLSDVQQIYKNARLEGVAVNSWDDLEHYLEQKGVTRWHLTSGEAKAMVADIKQVQKNNAPFPDNPQKTFDEMHKYRG